jgi:hypothetical protein
MKFLPIAGLCAALAGSMGVSPSSAQEEKFTRSTYPVANARPDGSRDLNPIANISGLWQSQSGARYSCSQNGRGFTCIAVTVTETQARSGVRVGDVAFTGIVYEYVAVADFIGRVPSIGGAVATCPSSYFKHSELNFRISDDSRVLRGELLIHHMDGHCTQDGATIQEALLRRID